MMATKRWWIAFAAEAFGAAANSLGFLLQFSHVPHTSEASITSPRCEKQRHSGTFSPSVCYFSWKNNTACSERLSPGWQMRVEQDIEWQLHTVNGPTCYSWASFMHIGEHMRVNDGRDRESLWNFVLMCLSSFFKLNWMKQIKQLHQAMVSCHPKVLTKYFDNGKKKVSEKVSSVWAFLEIEKMHPQ